jgi:hypothetical protein
VPPPNADFVAVSAGEHHSLGLKAHTGDLNCAGSVTFEDINSFVVLLSGS